jgi:hypothetical protein
VHAIAIAAFLLSVREGSAHPLVHMLPLPAHATIDPDGSRSLMAASNDGAIAASITVGGFRARTIVWRGGERVASVLGTTVGFDRNGGLFVDAGRPLRLAGTRTSAVDTGMCEAFPHDSLGPVLAGDLSNGALILTMRSPAIVDLDDTSGQNAPVVLYARSGRCLNLGNGIALATAGMYSAGYTAYIANVPAPSNVVSSSERFTAMRWHERERQPLGSGVALAINAAGAAAGSDVPPGRGSAFNALPHAQFWPSPGKAIELAPNAPQSVAYAIDDRDRIAGMLEDGGRHYAFIWENGTLRRLDDIAAAGGWRLESAYAFTRTGGIAGIGTYRGTAEAFVIDGL